MKYTYCPDHVPTTELPTAAKSCSKQPKCNARIKCSTVAVGLPAPQAYLSGEVTAGPEVVQSESAVVVLAPALHGSVLQEGAGVVQPAVHAVGVGGAEVGEVEVVAQLVLVVAQVVYVPDSQVTLRVLAPATSR